MPTTKTQPDVFYRSAELVLMQRKDGEPDNVVKVITSTSDPVRFGNWREVLLHDSKNVNTSAARSALLNHDRNQLVGGIKSIEFDGTRGVAELELDPDARTQTGVKILDAVRKGYLRGISIGYRYSDDDVRTVEEDGKYTVTVKKWRLLEITLTPTQADPAAHVLRCLPGRAALAAQQALVCECCGKDKATPPAPRRENEPAPAPVAPVAPPAPPAPAAPAQRDADDKSAIKLAREVTSLAREHGLESDSYLDQAEQGKSRSEIFRTMLKDAAEKRATTPTENVAVDLTRDAVDKLRDAATDGLLAMAGIRQEKDLGMRHGSVLDIGRLFVRGAGIKRELPRHELAKLLLGKDERVRDAANVTSSQFTSYVLVNAMDKAVMAGFKNFERLVSYGRWTNRRQVTDFKSFYGGALDTGNLVETPENVAFPELTKSEGGYSSKLKMWGATLSLTLQALVNDDLGEFMSALGRAGAIAQRTIDKQVYTALAAATWTGHTMTSGDLAAATLDKARSNMANVTGPAGEKLGMTPSFLITPSGLRTTALQLTKQVQGATEFNAHTDLEVVVTPFLDTETTPSESTWYLAAHPSVADTVIVALLAGMETPQVEEYDAGAVAARKWKIQLPFVAVVPTGLYGMYQAKNS